MPPDKIDIGKLSFMNLETGEKIELKGIANIGVASLDTREFADIIPIEFPKEYHCSFDISKKSDRAIKTLLGYKQVKTHKKKRINKKWAKMYGWMLAIKGWEVEK